MITSSRPVLLMIATMNGAILLILVALPFFGVPPKRVDLFGCMEVLGPILALASIGLAFVGRRRNEKGNLYNLALAMNLAALVLTAVFFVKL